MNMLERHPKTKTRTREELDHFFYDPGYITYADIIGFVRRYFATITSCLIVGALIAVYYVKSTTPLYTAQAKIFLDPKTTQIIESKAVELSLDAAKIESQIALITSDSILRPVVDGLNLKSDPEFQAGRPSFIRRILSGDFGSSNKQARQDTPESEKTLIAVEALRSRLDVRRSGLAYVLDISFTSMEPEKAARLANAIADSYEREQIEARAQAARQNSDWLETRIYRLRDKLDEAARRLQSVKAGREYLPATAPGPNAGDEPASVETMEAEVDAYRKIYESYYQSLTTAGEQQTFPFSNARVITAATPPMDKSHPKSKLIVVLGMFGGLLAGMGLAFLRASMDASVRTPKHIRDAIGLDCLARIPRIPRGLSLSWKRPFIKAGTPTSDRHLMFRYVSEAPFSQFAGAVTALKSGVVKSGRQDGIRVVGVTSALPEEGKSTLAANLAAAFSLSSYRVLLIDADIHNSVISQTFAPKAQKGLFEVLKGESKPVECIISRRGAGPDILPVVPDKQGPISYNWLSSESMLSMLATLKDEYHFIVLDLAPLTPVADGLTISSLLDGVLLAVEWGKTPRDLIADVAYGLNLADANILGVVLTKVDEAAVNLRLKKTWKYY
jgi:capsular exopolysaccharide synthesis family protein